MTVEEAEARQHFLLTRAWLEVAEGDNEAALESIEADLVSVKSLDQDRIIRSLLGLINATVRTTAYRERDASGAPSGSRHTTAHNRITTRNSSENLENHGPASMLFCSSIVRIGLFSPSP